MSRIAAENIRRREAEENRMTADQIADTEVCIAIMAVLFLVLWIMALAERVFREKEE